MGMVAPGHYFAAGGWLKATKGAKGTTVSALLPAPGGPGRTTAYNLDGGDTAVAMTLLCKYPGLNHCIK